jgi:hypothetical protein
MFCFYHRKTCHGTTSKDIMKKAVEVENDGKSMHQASKDYSIPYFTL